MGCSTLTGSTYRAHCHSVEVKHHCLWRGSVARLILDDQVGRFEQVVTGIRVFFPQYLLYNGLTGVWVFPVGQFLLDRLTNLPIFVARYNTALWFSSS